MEMLTEPKKVIFPQSYSPNVVTLNLFQGLLKSVTVRRKSRNDRKHTTTSGKSLLKIIAE